jgi:hypothetical protein
MLRHLVSLAPHELLLKVQKVLALTHIFDLLADIKPQLASWNAFPVLE